VCVFDRRRGTKARLLITFHGTRPFYSHPVAPAYGTVVINNRWLDRGQVNRIGPTYSRLKFVFLLTQPLPSPPSLRSITSSLGDNVSARFPPLSTIRRRRRFACDSPVRFAGDRVRPFFGRNRFAQPAPHRNETNASAAHALATLRNSFGRLPAAPVDTSGNSFCNGKTAGYGFNRRAIRFYDGTALRSFSLVYRSAALSYHRRFRSPVIPPRRKFPPSRGYLFVRKPPPILVVRPGRRWYLRAHVRAGEASARKRIENVDTRSTIWRFGRLHASSSPGEPFARTHAVFYTAHIWSAKKLPPRNIIAIERAPDR